MDIEKIISGCKKNERKAQQALFSSFAPYVYTICRRYAKNDEDAKEIMQDCFLRIFNKIGLYKSEKGSLKAWINRLSIYESLNKTKVKSKIISMVNIDISELQIVDESQEDEGRKAKQEKLIRAIQELPNGYRHVLNLYVFERKSHKEIGEILNITAATSRSQLTRAKALLKQLIQKDKFESYGT